MPSTHSPFRVVCYNALGYVQGETSSVTRITINNSLDKVGSVSFSVPATDPFVLVCQPGAYFLMYHEQDGYIGTFFFKTRNISQSDAGGVSAEIQGDDVMVQLRRRFVGYRRKYDFQQVSTVVSSLLALAGWTGSVDAGIGNTTVEYEGETILSAIDVLRDRWHKHFRLSTTIGVLEFGAFGQDSGVVLQRLEGQVSPSFEANANIAHVTNIKESVDADGVYNVIVATSGGQGSEAELTMQGSSVGSYPLYTGANQDGTLYYYIADLTSIAQYGVRYRVVKFPGIKPISNNATDIQRARDATKYAAEAYLRRNKDPIREYDLSVVGLRSNVRVGDLVTLNYRSQGVELTGEPFIDVNQTMYLMDRRDIYTLTGKTSQLTICTSDARRTSDTDTIVDVIRDVSVLKLHVQPYPFWKESDSQDFAGIEYTTLARRNAKFNCEIDKSVMALTKVKLRFKSRPLYTTSFEVPPSVTNGTPASWAVVWGLVEGDQHPKDVRLFIDGVDRTVFYGGPWNVRLSGTPGIAWTAGQYENNALDVTLDITNDIVNSGLGMQATHVIEFQAGGERQAFTYAVPASGTGTSLLGDATSGIIQCNIQIQGVTQGIVPT